MGATSNAPILLQRFHSPHEKAIALVVLNLIPEDGPIAEAKAV